MNAVAIILASFNRKELLKRAFESCKKQVNPNFDLIIFDDGSTDGAREYLRSIQHDPAITALILNDINMGFSRSVNRALRSVQTEWATILCDDDFLDGHFVEYSLDVLQSTRRDCVAVGFNYVDEKGLVLRTFRQDKQSLDGQQALLDSNIPVAGISGFFFRPGQFPNKDFMRDYPRAFFSDTLLFLQAVLPNGIETIDRVLYNKTLWDQSESSIQTQSAMQFFEAMLMFQKDVRILLENSQASPQVKQQIQKIMPYHDFIRILLLPILARDCISRQNIVGMFELARRYDKRYWLHCVLFSMAFPLANTWTLGLRKKLHRLYRRLTGRHFPVESADSTGDLYHAVP
jgi:glycosyltransferase involved in cell wall biosynthesis